MFGGFLCTNSILIFRLPVCSPHLTTHEAPTTGSQGKTMAWQPGPKKTTFLSNS